MRWLSTRGRAVRTLRADLWNYTKSSPSWSGGAAGFLALTPNLHSLDVTDDCNFFQEDSALACLSHLTGLRRLNLTLSALTNSFMQPAASSPLCHLTALESLTLSLDIYGSSFQLSEHLTVLCRLTFLSLQGSNDGLDDEPIAMTVPMLPSLRHLTLGGFLDKRPATLAQFSQLQSLYLEYYYPGESSLMLAPPGTFLHLTHVELEVAEELGLLGWLGLFDYLVQLPALQSLTICAPTLCHLVGNAWGFHPQLQKVNSEHAHDEDCPANTRSVGSHVMCLVAACSCIYQFPDGPSLETQLVYDLSNTHDIFTQLVIPC